MTYAIETRAETIMTHVFNNGNEDLEVVTFCGIEFARKIFAASAR